VIIEIMTVTANLVVEAATLILLRGRTGNTKLVNFR